MKSTHRDTADAGGAHRRGRQRRPGEPAARAGGPAAGPGEPTWPDGKRGRHAADGPPDQPASATAPTGGTESLLGPEPVARRTATGWRVGDEEVSDLTSAMVLADLLAADLPTQAMPAFGGEAAGAYSDGERPDPRRLEQTVAQLEHALTARVRVEQAIGVLAERHRLRPRQAFELLRSVARASGRRVLEIATEVVESATNPLLRIPEELAKPPMPRRGRRARPGWEPQ
jgi:ANTAR domain